MMPSLQVLDQHM